MIVSKIIEIDTGHRVPSHKGKCKSLHGHRYKIEVGVDDKVITEQGSSDEGMVIDYSDLKEIMMQEIDEKFDHGLVLYEEDILVGLLEYQDLKLIQVPFIPTAENLAKYWYELIRPKLQQRNIAIKFVRVWETPNSTAVYEKN